MGSPIMVWGLVLGTTGVVDYHYSSQAWGDLGELLGEPVKSGVSPPQLFQSFNKGYLWG